MDLNMLFHYISSDNVASTNGLDKSNSLPPSFSGHSAQQPHPFRAPISPLNHPDRLPYLMEYFPSYNSLGFFPPEPLESHDGSKYPLFFDPCCHFFLHILKRHLIYVEPFYLRREIRMGFLNFMNVLFLILNAFSVCHDSVQLFIHSVEFHLL